MVLGGGEDVAALGEGAERLTTAVELARRFPDAKAVFAGGSGRLRDAFGSPLGEADIAGRFLSGQGLDSGRLIFDRISRNTAENAVRAKALARLAPGERWVLVTSAFHMPRALRSFEAAGWPDIVPYPVDCRTGTFRDGLGWDLTRNLSHLQSAVKELAGTRAYRHSGK